MLLFQGDIIRKPQKSPEKHRLEPCGVGEKKIFIHTIQFFFNMPTQRKWNKFAIAAAIVLAIALFGAPFIGLLILPIATTVVTGISAVSPMAGFIVGWIANWLLHIVAFSLSVKALLSINSNTEKGKPLSWAVLIITVLILFVSVAANIMKAQSLSELTGKSVPQIVNEGGEVEIRRSQARDAYKVSNSKLLQNFLQEYQASNSRYPLNKTEIDSAWTNRNKVDWEGITYLYVDSSKSYVIRTQLEEDYSGSLNKVEDKDGMQGSLDCNDEALYFCLTP